MARYKRVINSASSRVQHAVMSKSYPPSSSPTLEVIV